MSDIIVPLIIAISFAVFASLVIGAALDFVDSRRPKGVRD